MLICTSSSANATKLQTTGYCLTLGETLTIYDILLLIRRILPLLFTPKNILRNFEKTVIWLYNPKIFTEDNLASFATDRLVPPNLDLHTPFSPSSDLLFQSDVKNEETLLLLVRRILPLLFTPKNILRNFEKTGVGLYNPKIFAEEDNLVTDMLVPS